MTTKIYTDGGCSGNPGPGGWAFIVVHDGEQQQRSGGERHTTNNRMELTAVIQALRELRRHPEWTGRQVELFTDSQYVQRGISQWIHGWLKNGWLTSDRQPVKNRELWQELHGLSTSLPVRWHWLRGHAGHPENEACDRLVQAAIRRMAR